MLKSKIMIVEDEAILAADLAERLKKSGHKVTGTVSTGTRALHMIAESPPDLVLMDIKIQGEMDGIDTAEEILSKYQIPIIYLTAYSSKSLLKRARQTEPFAYLVKPVDDRKLTASIETTLYKAKRDAERAERIKKLSKTLNETKTLQGILPICCMCKKIRNDEGYWEKLESYIQRRTEARFSHSFCTECANIYYPDIDFPEDDHL